MNLTMEIVLAVLGVIVQALVRFDAIRKEKGVKFSASYWIKDNWMRVIVTFIVCAVLFMTKDYVEPVLGVTLNPLNSFFMGYGCHDISMRVLSYNPFQKNNKDGAA